MNYVNDMAGLQSPVDVASSLARIRERQGIMSMISKYKAMGHETFVKRYGYDQLKDLYDQAKAVNVSFDVDYSFGELSGLAVNELLFGIPGMLNEDLAAMSRGAVGEAKIAKGIGLAAGLVVPLGPGARLATSAIRGARLAKTGRAVEAVAGAAAKDRLLQAFAEVTSAGKAGAAVNRAAVLGGVAPKAKTTEKLLTEGLQALEKHLAGNAAVADGSNFVTRTFNSVRGKLTAGGSKSELLRGVDALAPTGSQAAEASAAEVRSLIADWSRRGPNAIFADRAERLASRAITKPNLGPRNIPIRGPRGPGSFTLPGMTRQIPLTPSQIRKLEQAAATERSAVKARKLALKKEDIALLEQQLEARRKLIGQLAQKVEPGRALALGLVGGASGAIRGGAKRFADEQSDSFLERFGAGAKGAIVGGVAGGGMGFLGGSFGSGASQVLGGSRVAMLAPGAGVVWGSATNNDEVVIASLAALAGMNVR